MPLKAGKSAETRQENIKEMIASGHEPKQAVAAAYSKQRESGGNPGPKKVGVGKAKAKGKHVGVPKKKGPNEADVEEEKEQAGIAGPGMMRM
jgi:hypothetical protein